MNSGKNKLRRYWFSAMIAAFFMSLVGHIYLTTKPNYDGHANLQLSRIDFITPLDSATANKIKGLVGSLPGVKSTYFNIPTGALVYTFNPETQTSAHVYSLVMAAGNYRAEKYVVSKNDLKGGCPVMSRNEVGRRLSMYFAKLMS